MKVNEFVDRRHFCVDSSMDKIFKSLDPEDLKDDLERTQFVGVFFIKKRHNYIIICTDTI